MRTMLHDMMPILELCKPELFMALSEMRVIMSSIHGQSDCNDHIPFIELRFCNHLCRKNKPAHNSNSLWGYGQWKYP